MTSTTTPDFRSEAFLRAHIADTMSFYHPRAIDPDGGFFHYFRDDGSVYDASHRHLVSSTRFVFNYAMAAREFGNAEYLDAARHGLRYLRDVHRDESSGGYAWTIRDGVPEDRTNHCYGVAFVLLAYSTALKAGIDDVVPWIDETWGLLEARSGTRMQGSIAMKPMRSGTSATIAARTRTCTCARRCSLRTKRRASRASSTARWRSPIT